MELGSEICRPNHLSVRLQAPLKKEMPRVEAGRNSCHVMRGKPEAAPTRFDFNTYRSKLLKIKKAASSYNAKSKLTR
ncbi:MAG: hypothetical protein ACLPKT_18495 [Methylocella sp.]